MKQQPANIPQVVSGGHSPTPGSPWSCVLLAPPGKGRSAWLWNLALSVPSTAMVYNTARSLKFLGKLSHEKTKRSNKNIFYFEAFQTHQWRRQWHPTRVLLPGNPMGGGAWQAAVHGVAKSRTGLSNFTFTFSLSCIGERTGNPLQFLPGESQGQESLVG